MDIKILDNINQINPKFWGKSYWILLNSLAFVYNTKNKQEYKDLINLLSKLLPCHNCREHLKNNIVNIDEHLENKNKLINWLLKVRNSVPGNKVILSFDDIHKEIYNPDVKINKNTKTDENVKHLFDSIFHTTNTNTKSKMVIFIFVILIVFVAIFFIIKKMKKILKKMKNKK